MYESLLGLPKLSLEIDERKLLFLQRLIRMSENSATKQIFILGIFTYLNSITGRTPLGFVPDSLNILAKYNLANYLNDYITNNTFPSTAVWKRTVVNVLYQYHVKFFQKAMASDTDFVRFMKIHNVIKPTIIWQVANTPTELKLTHFIVKWSVLIPRQVSEVCRNCGLEFSYPLKHITTPSISILNVRTVFWDYLIDALSSNCSVFLSGLDNEEFLHVLLRKRLFIIKFQNKSKYFAFVKICANYVCSAVKGYYGT